MPEQTDPKPNSTLFKGLYKEVWRKMMPEGLSKAEVDFIEEISSLKPGDHLVDIMCGYGRHAIELARRGYRVTAVDNSAEYLKEIDTASATENLSIVTRQEDVFTISFPQNEYTAAVCMGNYFSSFDAENASIVLSKIAASLKQGGTFIINSWMIAEMAIRDFQQKTWLYVDEYKYLLDNNYLLNPARMETDHIIITPDGHTEVLKGIDYIFTFSELEALLKAAGFAIKEIYSTPRKRKYQFGDKIAYIVSEKL